MNIKVCITDEEILSTRDVMLQLRPHLLGEDYLSTVKDVLVRSAHLVGAYDGGICVGCALFREQLKLATGFNFYIDDLVVDEARRGMKIGEALLNWIETEAKTLGAEKLILDSGVQRDAAHNFYFQRGFRITSFNFKKSLNGAGH